MPLGPVQLLDAVVWRLHHSDLTAGEAEGAGEVVGGLIGLLEAEDAAVPDG